ncbi:hypothetical protein BaRGS_00020849 [Batillaria attramentaria]|uniref:RING-type domain-containing protein n=1 Tax=Batillaria attramentaria TaxID=370345 RepID=A0ABD0KLQ0_9CAEN
MDFVEELREDFLICNICFEEYREPKQLPCLHTFCRPCLSKYIVGKVVETGAEWFPCPFCRMAIQPLQSGELRTWADSFPTNFFLAQLSSKLKDKAALRHHGHSDVTGDAEHVTKTKCPEHPQAYLVAYCTKQRRGACEECCVQRHVDCIRYHVRERDSKVMAEERLSEYRETVGALQVKLEGVRDTVNTHECDLDLRNEQLQLQTQAALSDIRSKFELLFLDQKRDLTKRIENYMDREKKRLSSVKEQSAELSKTLERVSKMLDPVGSGGGSAVNDLMVLDKVQHELKRQEQVMDKLRKDSVVTDIQFQPNKNVDSLLQGLKVGSLTTERKSQGFGGARPRVQRFASEPHAPRDSESSAYLPAHRASPPMEDVVEHSTRRGRERGRALSPPGGAASASSVSSAMADGEMYHEYDDHRDTRRRSDVHPSPKRAPTMPDFGAALIEESRRSRSVPRRPRPVSEGSSVSAPRRRAAPIETAIDDGPPSARSADRNVRVLETSPEIVPPHADSEDHQSERSARKSGARNRAGSEHIVSSSEDEAALSGNITTFPAAAGATGGGSCSSERDRSTSFDSEGSQQSRKIMCVRHFLATHDSDVKNTPGLVGISAVCRDRVAVCDRWNKVIKLLDISGRVLDVLAVAISGDAEPWDLAVRRPGLLAVTYPKEQKIRMIEVSDSGSRLAYRSHFNTRDGYASIATCDPTSLVASVCPPFGSPKIHVIDYMGAVLRTVDCAKVAYPRCVEVCGGEEIVVSDWTHHNVNIFTKEGAAKHCYTGVPGAADAQLKTPMGVAWDGRSSIFIVDGKTAKLHAISTETGSCSVIFSLAQVSGAELKLVTFVDASPELCRSERALVVTTTSGTIQVYDLCSY